MSTTPSVGGGFGTNFMGPSPTSSVSGFGGFSTALNILQLGTGISSAISQFGTADTEQAAFNLNANIARQDRELEKFKRGLDIKKERRALKSFSSTQQALFAKAGVTPEGSPLDVLEETAFEGELAILVGTINSSIRQSRLETEALQQELAGERARTTGRARAGTTLLSTTTDFLSNL